MAGSWDFWQELNFATSGGGNLALCWCKAEEAVKMKRKSAAGIAKGSIQNHRLVEAGRDFWRSSGPSPLLQQGCLELVARDYVMLCHTIKCYSMLYTILCYAVGITCFPLYCLFSSERVMTQKFCHLAFQRRREKCLVF